MMTTDGEEGNKWRGGGVGGGRGRRNKAGNKINTDAND